MTSLNSTEVVLRVLVKTTLEQLLERWDEMYMPQIQSGQFQAIEKVHSISANTFEDIANYLVSVGKNCKMYRKNLDTILFISGIACGGRAVYEIIQGLKNKTATDKEIGTVFWYMVGAGVLLIASGKLKV